MKTYIDILEAIVLTAGTVALVVGVAFLIYLIIDYFRE